MTDIPTYEVYAIRYAEQLERADGATYLGGDPKKMIRGSRLFYLCHNRQWSNICC